MNTRSNYYVGETNKMLREGFGVYIYGNKFFIYEGEWENGEKHGHGRLVMADGSYYEGEFCHGEICGKGERFWSKSKNIYRGDFLNGELHGLGVMFYGNGDKYDGDWSYNVREGNGILLCSNGDEFEGEFYKHKQHGEGIMKYKNGNTYSGYWVCGMQHGHGKMILHDGSIYEGQFNHNIFHGEGTLYHASGIIYKGIWEQNIPSRISAKLKLANKILEVFQGHTFNISVTIETDNDEVVREESGRKLKVSVGIRYQPVSETNSLFELIEQMDIKPVETPLYPVLLVPLTNKPPKWITEFTKESNQNVPSSSSDFEFSEDFKNETKQTETINEASNEDIILEDICTDPVILNTENGTCFFDGLFIHQSDNSFPPYLLKDQEAGLLALNAQRKISVSNSGTKQLIKEQSTIEDVHAKRKRVGDERYTRPGEYVIIIEDVTDNPFMSVTLKPLYTTIKILPFSATQPPQNSTQKDLQKRRRSQMNTNKPIPESSVGKTKSKQAQNRRSSVLF